MTPDDAAAVEPKGLGEGGELPIVQKVYDLLAWLLPQVARFPRAQRFSIGARIEGHLFDLLELLVGARFARPGEKGELLRRASAALVRLRYLLRLAVDLRYLPLAKQEHMARELGEIGRMLGGWMKAKGAA